MPAKNTKKVPPTQRKRQRAIPIYFGKNHTEEYNAIRDEADTNGFDVADYARRLLRVGRVEVQKDRMRILQPEINI